MRAADLVYGFHVKGLLRSLGYDRPKGALWFRLVSLAWLAGYKLEYADDDSPDPHTMTVVRFTLTPRDTGPFVFEATITL